MKKKKKKQDRVSAKVNKSLRGPVDLNVKLHVGEEMVLTATTCLRVWIHTDGGTWQTVKWRAARGRLSEGLLKVPGETPTPPPRLPSHSASLLSQPIPRSPSSSGCPTCRVLERAIKSQVQVCRETPFSWRDLQSVFFFVVFLPSPD